MVRRCHSDSLGAGRAFWAEVTRQRKRPPWVSRTKLHVLLAEQGALCWQDTASPDKGNRWLVQGFRKRRVLGLVDLQNHLGTDWALVVEVWLPEWGHCWWACFRSLVQRQDYWCKVVIDHFWHLFAIVAKAQACLFWDLESWQANTGRWTTWTQLWGVWLADVTSHYFLQDSLQIKTHYSQGGIFPTKEPGSESWQHTFSWHLSANDWARLWYKDLSISVWLRTLCIKSLLRSSLGGWWKVKWNC